MIPHRSTTLLTAIVFIGLLLVIFSSTPSTPDPSTGEEPVSGPAKYVPRPKLPALSDLHLPSFYPTAHKPPATQPDSASGGSKWLSDLSWLNPFSSSTTLEEDRSVLPPLRHRPYVYTYYNADQKNGGPQDNADAGLLLAWRRAWFAQGFRPVILGRGEAIHNPIYEMVQNIKFGTADIEHEVLRWLAWGHMGDGILVHWRCFPMARYDDPLLSYLRRGTDPAVITRLDKIQNGLFAGTKDRINEVIKKAVSKGISDQATNIFDLVAPETFKVEQTNAVAWYNSAAIVSHYPALAEKMDRSRGSGTAALAELVHSHLHNTFQNAFPAGIAVLKPFPEHTTALVEPALRLARALGRCPPSPMPDSCPPNLPRCRPCDPEKPMHISQPQSYRNTTHVFSIGTLPHPYTLVSLRQNSAEVTTRHIRRETERDEWLQAVTQEQLGLEISGSARASVLKKVVADDDLTDASLWMTVESIPPEAGQALPTELLNEFEWQLGFPIPREEKDKVDAKNEGASKESLQNANPSREGVGREYEVLQAARAVLHSKEGPQVVIRDVVEAWNLADTEVWRFVRAFRARSVFERQRWEEEEKNFLGPLHH
ncbi:uncharacterized protein BDW47DRAFT_68462 [Aspergillus candidus]|uniref:Uncharacterized protein n=1 Tax=Aspergillus candidus TaxID=41067 RepID=A0A2I2F395_ASPCN|nr:hypothetical protein BDW47DRAFT_68462 [Aspergillus candidus]PLB35110.1 hypothetical protein BDW47DRAFT_68462 [Aspergillus candidus]